MLLCEETKSNWKGKVYNYKFTYNTLNNASLFLYIVFRELRARLHVLSLSIVPLAIISTGFVKIHKDTTVMNYQGVHQIVNVWALNNPGDTKFIQTKTRKIRRKSTRSNEVDGFEKTTTSCVCILVAQFGQRTIQLAAVTTPKPSLCCAKQNFINNNNSSMATRLFRILFNVHDMRWVGA